ncbi:GNAT family N-acetyltransferase [Deinococcus hohokamensis]|uniref:GNAT family N-acetyltransferase n=1 Tax=Deinococcus hohokamensis TaxID=309883 RepID=A0ABV9IGN0_9DEIO
MTVSSTASSPQTLSTMHINLRQAAPEDFPVILDLLGRCGLHTASVTPAGSTYWIASLDGVPGGCIGLEHGEGASLIRSTAVLPDARSQGLGRALVLSALTQATLRGDHTVYLFSSEAGDYWRRFGFVPATAAQVAQALPEAAQVSSGVQKGWIHDEQVWQRAMTVPGREGG